MHTKLLQFWVNLRASFWFAPAVMMLAAAMLAASLVAVDAVAGLDLARSHPHLFGASAEGARSILSTLASSMINVAGVTFSITIVTLSLATGQYTSRVLRNFMRDRANQVVLGAFVSIFVYCIIVLRTIRGEPDGFVPSLAVFAGIVLGFGGIVFLIFFIHHVATSIQASGMICRIAEETLAVIDTLYPDTANEERESPEADTGLVAEHHWRPIPSGRTGYVQTIDVEGIVAWAVEHDAVVRILRGTGEFVIAENPGLAVAVDHGHAGPELANVNVCFSTAPFRTIEGDPAFGIRQLVDIALKALSPGMNDTTTAVTCLHYLGSILARLSRRRLPPPILRHEGEIRLILRTPTYPDFVDACFNQILEHARGNVAVLLTMLEVISAADRPDLSRARRAALVFHAERILQAAGRHVDDPSARSRIEAAARPLTTLAD
jgi:uncharacterized membrane protein